MQIVNTSHLSTQFIRKVADWVIPAKFYGINLIKVTSRCNIALDGTYYPNRKQMFLIIGEKSCFPSFSCANEDKKMGYIKYLIRTPEEGLVYLLSHEYRHSWQCNRSKREWTNGRHHSFQEKKKRFIIYYKEEHDADRFAKKKLDEWRNEYLSSTS